MKGEKMENREMVKEAVKSAEEELKEEIRNKEKLRIKGVVKATLELLQKKEEARKLLDDEIKILRKDISDLRDGRIDRIKERQDLDPKAKDISVIIIKERIIEKQVSTPMWYIPWVIEVKPQYVPYIPVYCGTVTISNDPGYCSNNALGVSNTSTDALTFTVTNSNAHMYAGGTYVLENNAVKYI